MWQRRLFFWFSLQKQTKQTGTIDGQLIIDTEATEVVHGGGGGGGGGHLHRLSVGLSTISFLIISLSIGTQTWPLEMRLSARHTPTHTLTMRHFFNRFFFIRSVSFFSLSLSLWNPIKEQHNTRKQSKMIRHYLFSTVDRVRTEFLSGTVEESFQSPFRVESMFSLVSGRAMCRFWPTFLDESERR